MRNKVLVAVALVASSLVSSVAVKADRPLVSEEPQLQVGVGQVKIDGGVTYTRAGLSKSFSVDELQVKTGLSNKSEVFIRSNYLNLKGNASGFTPVEVGLKYSLSPNSAVVLSTTTPTGYSAFKRNYEPRLIFAVGKEIGKGRNLIGNIGYQRSDNGFRSNTAIGSLALTQEISAGKLFAEVYGTADRRLDETVLGAVGFSRRVSDDVTLDARVGRNFKEDRRNYFVGFGFTILR